MKGHTPKSIPSPKLASSHVADPDGLLGRAARIATDNLLRGAPHEVAIAVISRTRPGLTFEQFCKALFNFWGVGSKADNDGVLYVLALSQREHRIVTGPGIKPYLTDEVCQDIVKSAGKLLREGNVDAAVLLVARRVVNGIWWGKVWRRLRVFVAVAALLVAAWLWRLARQFRLRAEAYAERAGRLKQLAEAAVSRLEERSGSHNLEANPCPICLDCLSSHPLHPSDFQVQEGQSVVRSVELLRCGHLAHEHCVSEWLGRSNSCPLCRLDDPRLLGAVAAPVVLSLASPDTVQQLRHALNWQFQDLGDSRQTELWRTHFEGSPPTPRGVSTSSPSPGDANISWDSGSSFGGGSCAGGGGAGGSF